jgi:hypothetical protein
MVAKMPEHDNSVFFGEYPDIKKEWRKPRKGSDTRHSGKSSTHETFSKTSDFQGVR